MTNKESTELAEPCVGAFDDPASSLPPEFPSVFIATELAALAVWDDEVDASLGQPFSQRIGVVRAVGDDALRLLSRMAILSQTLEKTMLETLAHEIWDYWPNPHR